MTCESLVGTESLIVYIAFFLLSIVGVATLVIVARLYGMHNVKNSDGQLAWFVPDSWVCVQESLVKTQELMASSLAELTVHNKQISKLLETQTNVSLELYQELMKLRDGTKRDE